MEREAFVRALDELFGVSEFGDYCPNGLQVEGKSTVQRVVTGVTASLALIERAAAAHADAIVVHHGIFWDGASPVLRGSLKKRVSALLHHEITLLGYHLPFDRHPAVGNNAPALRALGCVDLEPFGEHKGKLIGWKGRLLSPEDARAFAARVAAYYESVPTAFLHGPRLVRTVGMVSGAAQSDLSAAVSAGLDCFITGEVSEYNLHIATEDAIHHISVGHHASERVGPRCLAEYLRTTLGLDAEFVDIPNPA